MAAIIMFDMRCLQTEAAPDVAAHARRVISLARHVSSIAKAARLIGMFDPGLPAPDARAAAWVDALQPHAYLAAAPPGSLFLNPAPFAEDQVFVARLLLRPDIFKAAIVETLDTSLQPEPEPRDTAGRLGHATALTWLRHYDVLLPRPAFALHPEDAAKATWRVIDEQMPKAELPKISIGGRRPRVAMLTPLPPARSGVADYSAALATELGHRVELTLFAPRAAKNAEPVSALAHLSRRYDRVVSVMGNAPFHNNIHDLHTRYGSAVICHDSRLLHFFHERFGPARVAEMAARELGRPVSLAELQHWLADEQNRGALCLGNLPVSASPFIMHAPASVAAVAARYGTSPRLLPFAIYRHWPFGALSPAQKRAARARLGFAETEKIIASFGHVNTSKAVDAAIQAMALLPPETRLIWVGKTAGNGAALQAAADRLGTPGRIRFIDKFVSETQYRDYLLAADCGLQLRRGAGGNISGALQDCIAAGLPTVANDDLAAALDAPRYVARVGDTLDPAPIAAALEALLSDRQDTQPERAAYTATHGMAAYAEGLCRILELG